MLIPTLFQAGQESGDAAATFAVGSAVTVTQTAAGTCIYDEAKDLWSMGERAKLTIAWEIGSGDPATYQSKVYKDGVLQATVALGTESYEYNTNYVAYSVGGDDTASMSNVVFRVDIVRISDGVVIATKSADPYSGDYGICTSEPL